MSPTEREQMIASAEHIRHKFSPFMQEVEYKLTNEIINDVAESLTVTKKPMNEKENVSLEKINLLHASYGFGRVLDTDKKIDPDAPIYKVQFMATKREKKVDTRFYRHLSNYEVVKEKGLEQIGSAEELEVIITEIIAANPENVAKYKSGKAKLFGFFVGQTMKKTQGKGNPKVIQELLKKHLSR